MSLCAKCGSVMGERTYREMPLEVCPECQGQWMDHTTLEHILNRLAADQVVGSLQFGVLAEFMNRVETIQVSRLPPLRARYRPRVLVVPVGAFSLVLRHGSTLAAQAYVPTSGGASPRQDTEK